VAKKSRGERFIDQFNILEENKELEILKSNYKKDIDYIIKKLLKEKNIEMKWKKYDKRN